MFQAQEAELKKQLDETIAKRKMEQEVRNASISVVSWP